MNILIISMLAVIICGPLLTIMSINTLFGLGIEITFWSWLSALWLSMIVGSAAGSVANRGSK